MQKPDASRELGGKFWRPLVAFAFHALAIAPLVHAVNLDWPGLFVACTAYFVVFGFLLHSIESLFYFQKRLLTWRHFLGGILAFVLVAAVASFWAIPLDGETVSMVVAIELWISSQSGNSVFSIGYSTITFMVVYCIIGSATWPFVREYYEDPNSKLALRVPNGKTVITLQLSRGLVATLAIIPLVAGLGDDATNLLTWGYLALTLSVTFAITPMLMAPENWPARLRFMHGTEIAIFVTIQSFAWWWFLAR
jgi:hypothetical protein